MRHSRIVACATLVLLLRAPGSSGVNATRAAATPVDHAHMIDSLLGAMTLEQKLGQLNLVSGQGDTLTPAEIELVRQGRVGGFLNVVGARATRMAQRIAIEESPHRIPLLFGYDVIHGFRTIFPIPLAEASSWDTAAAALSARVAAREAAAAGVNWTYAPMVDIARDPRWGRIAEGAGEDPFLGSAFAVARVRGFQGEDLGPGTVLATAKHFAAYGAAEGGRDYNTVDISERTLREVYLPPFEAAVTAGVGSIMASFNEIAGVPSTANRRLLTGVLRKEWGFDGLTVSDWTAINELRQHGTAGTRARAGELALAAGIDMDMQSGIYVAELAERARAGAIPLAEVDEAVRRVLRAKARLGLFERPYRDAGVEAGSGVPSPENRRAAREVARRSIVLLKNDGAVLPLASSVRTLAVIGPLADSKVDMLGPWYASGKAPDAVTVLTGIRERAGSRATVLYARGCSITDTATAGFAAALQTAARAQVVIMVLGEAGEMSGEAASRSTLGLPGVQQALLERVTRLGKPVVLLVMNGRPLALPWAAEHVPAILETWFLGIEAGHAIADVLYGDESPSGKLPVTFPRSVGQIPIYYNHKNSGRPPSDTDKFTSKYLDLPSTPLYPFGWGLSYTTFRYDSLQLSPTRLGPSDSLVVRVTVANVGSRAGTEIVQLYLSDEDASVTRPVRRLAGFQRVSLGPHETRTITFALGPARLGFYGEDMAFAVEPGPRRVIVGPNSATGLEAGFTVVRRGEDALR